MCTPGGDEASFLCPNGTSKGCVLDQKFHFKMRRCHWRALSCFNQYYESWRMLYWTNLYKLSNQSLCNFENFLLFQFSTNSTSSATGGEWHHQNCNQDDWAWLKSRFPYVMLSIVSRDPFYPTLLRHNLVSCSWNVHVFYSRKEIYCILFLSTKGFNAYLW